MTTLYELDVSKALPIKKEAVDVAPNPSTEAPPEQKVKRPRTEKQKEAVKKMLAARKLKIEERKAESEKKKVLETNGTPPKESEESESSDAPAPKPREESTSIKIEPSEELQTNVSMDSSDNSEEREPSSPAAGVVSVAEAPVHNDILEQPDSKGGPAPMEAVNYEKLADLVASRISDRIPVVRENNVLKQQPISEFPTAAVDTFNLVNEIFGA